MILFIIDIISGNTLHTDTHKHTLPIFSDILFSAAVSQCLIQSLLMQLLAITLHTL